MNLYKFVGELYTLERFDDIELVPLGDFHIGHENFQEDLLRKYLNYVGSKPNRFITLMGDEIHAEIPAK